MRTLISNIAKQDKQYQPQYDYSTSGVYGFAYDIIAI